MAGKEKSYAVCGSADTGVIKNNSKIVNKDLNYKELSDVECQCEPIAVINPQLTYDEQNVEVSTVQIASWEAYYKLEPHPETVWHDLREIQSNTEYATGDKSLLESRSFEEIELEDLPSDR